jgi:hypothetical protein
MRNCRGADAQSKLNALRTDGLTPLYDALVKAAEILQENRDPESRPAMILFSDGFDDFGILKWPTSAVCSGPPLDTANFYSGFERELGSGGWSWTGEPRWSYSSRFGWSMSLG